MLPVAALVFPSQSRLCARIEQGRRINETLTLSPSPPFSQCFLHILWCSIGVYFLFQHICTRRCLYLIRTTAGVSRQPKSGGMAAAELGASTRRVHLESAHKEYWRPPRRAPQTMNECGRGKHRDESGVFPLSSPFPRILVVDADRLAKKCYRLITVIKSFWWPTQLKIEFHV